MHRQGNGLRLPHIAPRGAMPGRLTVQKEYSMSESKSVLKRLDIQQATTWKSWVQTVGGDEWNTNACVYATKEEA